MKLQILSLGLALLSCITISVSALAQKQKEKKVKVSGHVVAYDLGIENSNQTKGQCTQRIILNSKGNKFYLILHRAACSALFPENFLRENQKWKVSLTREPSCDASFEELEYISSLSPDGTISKIAVMKRTPAGQELEFPKSSIPCYAPSANCKLFQQRKLKGVVVTKTGQPVSKAIVRLDYENTPPNFFIYADENGKFEFNILSFFKYTLYAEGMLENRVSKSQPQLVSPDDQKAFLKLVLGK